VVSGEQGTLTEEPPYLVDRDRNNRKVKAITLLILERIF